MFPNLRRHRPVLGLDITTSSIKLIELSLSGGQYTVDSYAAEPTPQNAMNERAIVDALRRQARHEETMRWETIEFKLD